MIDFLKQLFFVPKCFLCGEPLIDKEVAFCAKCRLEVEKLMRTPCRICGKSQRECRCVPARLRSATSFGIHLFLFEDELSRRIIYALKRKNDVHLRRFLSQKLADAICQADIDLSEYALTFAPRKPKSVREYGFDQAELLCEELADRLDVPMQNLFRHARFSALQKELGVHARAENAEKSYSLVKNVRPERQNLIIVDDVMTTGSTLSKLAALAKEAGYREVITVTVAKTPPK